MAQHTVNLDGDILVATKSEDVELMYLLYITKAEKKLPYDTEPTLKELLFKNKDKTFEEQKRIVIAFYSQKNYTVQAVNVDDKTLSITIQTLSKSINITV